ncbi:MAG TPA: DegT/DnrJ/EryC1/StrS family aminotransferase [Bryobacteraceae bacterium]|nr:DegT/DnrJ/EryC1/StrS family aminotransferase [Bryobacteraceae bacterium]
MIPFFDLRPQTEALREEIHRAVGAVLDSREFTLGEHVHAFEMEFARACGVQHAIAVNSGTSALHLALLSAGVRPGDEVITVPFTFAATVAAIRYCGATPVFADIRPDTFTIDHTQFPGLLSERTRAIIPVHLYGQCAEMDPISRFAADHGLRVIEDAAQAHLAEYKGRRAGGLGHLGCFSFYPTKNLGAYGEGGMVTTSDDELAATVRLLRNWGQDRKYHHAVQGFNYRMEGFNGAILSVKLRYLEEWTKVRCRLAALYEDALEGARVIRPYRMPECRHVWHTYTVRSQDRPGLQTHLSEGGIGTAIHYPIPLHLQPAYADARWPKGSLPVSELAAEQVLSLPIYPEMPPEHVSKVAIAIQGH